MLNGKKYFVNKYGNVYFVIFFFVTASYLTLNVALER